MQQYESILNSLKRGVVARVYLLYGEEEYLQEKVIQAFKEEMVPSGMADFNIDEVEGEKCSPAMLVDLANTLPVFAEKRLVIVKDFPLLRPRNTKEETTDEEKEEKKGVENEINKVIFKYLDNPAPSTCLIFWQKGKVAKTGKLYKAITAAGEAQEISPLKGAELSQWLTLEAKRKGKKFDRPALEYLLFVCGNQLRHLVNELEKLALYTGDETIITLEAVQTIATGSIEGNIFNLVDGIGSGKTEEGLRELKNLLIGGEYSGMILAMIARQFRLLLQVKEAALKGLPAAAITAELKLPSFVTTKILRQARNYSLAELENNLELILEVDRGLKTGLATVLTLEKLIFDLTPCQKG